MLARLLETQRQMPMDEHDLIRRRCTKLRIGDVVVFGLESRNGRKDDVVYVHTGQVPQGRGCAPARRAGRRGAAVLQHADQIDSVFRMLRHCSFEQDVRTVVNGPPLLLFWLGQVLTRICDYHPPQHPRGHRQRQEPHAE